MAIRDQLTVLLLTGISLLTACSGTRNLSEGESFYKGAEIRFRKQGRTGPTARLSRELETYITPKPNTMFLGSRPGVWFYYNSGDPEKEKGLGNFIRSKLGQEPVLLEDATPQRTASLLEGVVENMGYFGSSVESEVKTKRKASTVIYTVNLHPPYTIRSIVYPDPPDSLYQRIIDKVKEESLIEERMQYDLDLLKAEQERIEKVVEDLGLYFFDDRHMIFQADTTVGNRQVNIYLKLVEDIPEKVIRVFRLDRIDVYPDFTITKDTLVTEDPLTIEGYYYYDRDEYLRPERVLGEVLLQPGDVYSRTARDLTQRRLMDLGVFKFVNIKFDQSDSAKLHTRIYLTPLPRRSVRMEFDVASKSNNFVGPGFTATYTDRNFFRGAELFQLKFNSGYEVQVSNNLDQPLNAFEIGVEGSVTVPRFILPFTINYRSSRYLPKTKFELSYTLQNRVGYFRLNSFHAGVSYNWNESAEKIHSLMPVDINFVKTDHTSAAFTEFIEANPFLRSSFEDQFILGSGYSFTLNTQLDQPRADEYSRYEIEPSQFYFNARVDIAGNLINTLQRGFSKSNAEQREFLGSTYSQFVRGAIDFRYYWQIDQRNKLATRLALGAGYAYGNSATLPYIKQFAVGGTNSIRAFPARSIGPGTYYARTDSLTQIGSFIDQRGDLKLEFSVEYRFDLVGSLKGAVFADAGNIWLLRRDDDRPGGAFDSRTFLDQLAVGTGVGLRYDFNFFVLRFDLAFPLRKPYLPSGEQWTFDEIDFGSGAWRRENFVLNIAIGYPF